MAEDLDEAELLLKEAQKIAPDNEELLNNYANLHLHRKRFDLAVVPLMKILAKNPQHSMAYANLGAIMNKWQDFPGARKCFEKALKCDTKNSVAAMRLMHNSLQLSAWDNWDDLDSYKKLFYEKISTMDPGIFLPIVDDPALQKAKSETYFNGLVGDVPQNRPAPRQRGEGDKIRLGYFSSDFHKHATMWLMIRMLELHDRERFEIFIYDYSTTADEMTERAKNAADHYRVVRRMSDEEVVALAQADGIDIAIDLKGYTSGHRTPIVFKNPAPVNVSYIGYPGTIGSSKLDYIVADEVMIPPSLRKYYSEKIIYMPDCYQVTNDQRNVATKIPTRAELGLPEDAFVFCSFNSHYKITPFEYEIWMRLLKKVDNSVMWIWCKEDLARENMHKAAEAHGVAPERVIFADSVSQEDHLARLSQADLFLDTFAVCAHTTASDAMWMGLPLVTLEGKQFAARVASSVLQTMDLPELVTTTMEEYEAVALEFATNPDKLAAVRAKIKTNRETSPMFKTERFTRNWEQQLERALVRCESGLKPDHLMP
nr:tetratricopeptide repeat protein [Tritonibacter litoralis]